MKSMLQPLELIILLLAALSHVWCNVSSLILKSYGKMVIYMFPGSYTSFIRSCCCDNQVTNALKF